MAFYESELPPQVRRAALLVGIPEAEAWSAALPEDVIHPDEPR